MLWREVGTVDIAPALALLPAAVFEDSGGTNGHLANPEPFMPFIHGLGLGKVTRAWVRKLPAGQGIPPHVDPKNHRSPKARERRFHVPLVTHPDVFLRWPDADAEVHLRTGCIYEVDHTQMHEVVNHAPVDRIHLVADTVEVAA